MANPQPLGGPQGRCCLWASETQAWVLHLPDGYRGWQALGLSYLWKVDGGEGRGLGVCWWRCFWPSGTQGHHYLRTQWETLSALWPGSWKPLWKVKGGFQELGWIISDEIWPWAWGDSVECGGSRPRWQGTEREGEAGAVRTGPTLCGVPSVLAAATWGDSIRAVLSCCKWQKWDLGCSHQLKRELMGAPGCIQSCTWFACPMHVVSHCF